jgi:S1-C subfamily serine protease
VVPASFTQQYGNNNSMKNLSLTDLFKKAENSVVEITARVSNPDFQIIINGNPTQAQSTRLGSGFVYDTQGHIVTNNHVIDGAKTVDVTFVDGNTYTAKVVGTDPFSDIAVLQITDNGFSAEKAIPLVIANSSTLQIGQQVTAIGNPFGLSDTMTTGIISQTGRLLPNSDTRFSIPDVIQTDAAVNPGNSGGPLLNMQGQVVGMNTAISSSTGEFSGVGFAVPSSDIIRVVPSLIENGCYSHPFLGISGTSLTPELAQAAGLPTNYRGVVVGSVQPGGPADRAGVQGVSLDQTSDSPKVGDVIVAIDGHNVKNMYDIISYIDDHKSVGDSIQLTINRQGQTMNLNAILGTRALPSPSSENLLLLPPASILP